MTSSKPYKQPRRTQAPAARPSSPLTQTVQSNDAPLSTVGSVSRVLIGSVGGSVGGFSLVLDNSAGGTDQQFIIGDPKVLLATLLGGSIQKPTSGTINPTILSNTLDIAPISIKSINYAPTVSAAQFDKPFEIVEGDIDGKVNRIPVDVAQAKRNNQFQDKLLTLDFGNTPVYLTWNRALLVTVGAGETVNLTITPGQSAGR